MLTYAVCSEPCARAALSQEVADFDFDHQLRFLSPAPPCPRRRPGVDTSLEGCQDLVPGNHTLALNIGSIDHFLLFDPILLESYGKVLVNDISGRCEAKLRQEVFHGLWSDLCNGQLFPMILHSNIRSKLEKPANSVLGPLLCGKM